MKNVLVTGGCGFIGSHAVERLLNTKGVEKVRVYDNLSSGTLGHVRHLADNPKLELFYTGFDLKDVSALTRAMAGFDTVFHFAANPDIARAAKEPTIDFTQGTVLLQNTLEAMRVNGVKTIFYASGSGVYGDIGTIPYREDMACRPISTYGASKLACEALISAYSHMFGIRGYCFRFANVVGPRQTHGVGYDFINRLWADPTRLTVLGDGNQSKSYIYVTDVLDAVFLAAEKSAGGIWNVSTTDYVTVNEIASLAKLIMRSNADIIHTGGSRGWSGDVPVVRFDSTSIRSMGWFPSYNSWEALTESMTRIKDDLPE